MAAVARAVAEPHGVLLAAYLRNVPSSGTAASAALAAAAACSGVTSLAAPGTLAPLAGYTGARKARNDGMLLAVLSAYLLVRLTPLRLASRSTRCS